MDYTKLDAALASAVSDEPDPATRNLSVFIHTLRVPDATESALLGRLGVSGDFRGRQTLTATLAVREIDTLSQQPWIKFLSLSQRLRPLPAEDEIARPRRRV